MSGLSRWSTYPGGTPYCHRNDIEAGIVVAAAADLLKVTPGDLDASIWRYQAR